MGLTLAALACAWAAPPALVGHGLQASWWDDALRPTGPADHSLLARSWQVSMLGNRASSNQTVFSIRWAGFVDLPTSGEWGFATDSDDGSKVWIGQRLVVDNGIRHPRRRREGTATLAAGEQPIKIEYAQTVGESYLRVECRPPGGDWQALPLAWVRPVPAAQFDRAATDRADLWRCLWLGLAWGLGGLALGLRLWVGRAGLLALVRDRQMRRARLRALAARPLVHDLAVVLICLPFYLQNVGARLPWDSYMKGDSIYYANTGLSIIQDFDLDQKNQTDVRIFEDPKPHTNIDMANSNIAKGSRGEWYPKHPVLMPILSAPFLAAWGGFGLVVYNLVSLLLLVALVRRAAARVASPGAAGVAAVAIGLTPVLHAFSYSYCPDLLSALIVVAGVWAALAKRPLVAGLLLGLSVWVKLPNGLAMGLVAGGLLLVRDWRGLLRYSAGATASLGIFAGLNWFMFGAPWRTGYSQVWVIEAGVHRIGDHLASFSRSLRDGLELQLFNPVHGLLPTAPAVVVAVLGYGRLFKRSRLAAWVIGLFSLGTFAFYTFYDYTHASHFGNRFLMPVIALAGLPLACLIDWLVGRARPDRPGCG